MAEMLACYCQGYTIIENYRPEWLSTGFGGRPELDFYIKEANVAIEVQGEQHYRRIAFFHPTEASFVEQRQRDELKAERCLLQAISLCYVASYSDAFVASKNIPPYIKSIDEKRFNSFDIILDKMEEALLKTRIRRYNFKKLKKLLFAFYEKRKGREWFALEPNALRIIHRAILGVATYLTNSGWTSQRMMQYPLFQQLAEIGLVVLEKTPTRVKIVSGRNKRFI